ncbi:Alcohol dehydrogenase [Planctomycetales bacterium 10988]|nr:Alcohol dehydrogenase [Planctomycetales bacterium 10988]
MLAGRIQSRGKIDLLEVPEPSFDDPPGPNDPREERDDAKIIFQPNVGCLCGSDLPYFDSDDEHGPYPHTLGQSLHEMVGEVVATNGKRFRPGDRVLAVPVVHHGLFERYRLSENRAIPLDTRVPEEEALLAQPLGTVIFALKKVNVLDQDVVVLGQGPMGQIINASLRILGARSIVAIDPVPERIELSRRMGATHAICATGKNALSELQKILPIGADLVIEAVGHKNQCFNACIDCCRKDGSILVFGVPPGAIDGVRMRDLFWKNLTVYSSVNPDFARDFPLAMQWIGEGRIDLNPLITHRYPLAQIQEAFELFRDHQDGCLKVLIDFPSAKKSAKEEL